MDSLPPASEAAGATTGWGSVAVVARYVLLLALGVLLGLVGAFLVPRGPRVGGSLISMGVVVALVGNVVAARLGAEAAGRIGAALPVGGWLVVAVAASWKMANGSLLLPGAGDLATASLLFLLLGAVAGVVTAIVVSSETGARRR